MKTLNYLLITLAISGCNLGCITQSDKSSTDAKSLNYVSNNQLFQQDDNSHAIIQNLTSKNIFVKVNYNCSSVNDDYIIIPPFTSRVTNDTYKCQQYPNIEFIDKENNIIGYIDGFLLLDYGFNSWNESLNFINGDFKYNLILGKKEGKNYHDSILVQVYDNNPVIDTKNWLQYLPNGTTLNKIIMPGSHDAGMDRADHITYGLSAHHVVTQRTDIYGQLLAGSRYFDIRPDIDHEELVTHHRTSILGANGEKIIGGEHTVLEDTYNFLTEHPSEFVILKFSHVRDGYGHSKDKTMDTLLNEIQNHGNGKYRNIIYTSNSQVDLHNTTLDKLRGKVVLVFDSTANNGEFRNKLNFPEFGSDKGYFRYNDTSIQADSRGMNVYDVYSNQKYYTKVASDQLAKLNKNGGMGKDSLFLLSWTATGQFGSNLNIRELAVPMIANIPAVLEQQYLEKGFYGLPNIVYMDFINPYTNMAIIYQNYKSKY